LGAELLLPVELVCPTGLLLDDELLFVDELLWDPELLEPVLDEESLGFDDAVAIGVDVELLIVYFYD
jgi:hypothetical protein